jgi:hypothetical protein
MRNITTKQKIVELIRANQGITAKGIISGLGLTKAIIFRHLRDLLDKKEIIKIGKTPKVKYFYQYDVAEKTNLEKIFFDWAITGKIQEQEKKFLCPARDVFYAREQKLLVSLKNMVNENLLYLLVGAASEIGNNSFDHNLGNWIDEPGLLFAIDTETREILLADRGAGVLFTIKQVRPQIANSEDALRVAFTEIISGRYPEHRGNGLKYVKKIIQENNLYLEFYSGDAMIEISKNNFLSKTTDYKIPGTLAIIKF